MSDEKKKFYLFENMWTVPNLLSFIRILLIPVFAVLFYKDNLIGAVICLAISGISDFLDGKIARRFNQVSELGKMLDPVADKLTQMTIAVVLFLKLHSAQDSLIKAFSWIFLVFIAKELLMVICGGIMILIGIKPGAAEIYGKVSTFVFYCVMIIIVCFGPEVGAFSKTNPSLMLPDAAMIVLVVISLILTFVALASYVPGALRQFKERKEGIKNGTWDKEKSQDTETEK